MGVFIKVYHYHYQQVKLKTIKVQYIPAVYISLKPRP